MDPKVKRQRRVRRHQRVRARIFGTSKRPRLSVFRSHKYVHLQLIDDDASRTLAAAYGTDPSQAGKLLAEKALDQGVKQAVFDRGGYKFHGRVKKAAEAALKAGLKL